MKLRIRENSLRLRVSKADLEIFEKDKKVKATINFPNNSKMDYYLIWGNDDDFKSTFDGSSIITEVPQQVGKRWLQPDEVTIDHYVSLENNIQLRLLIEKDFQCLTKRKDEDESDLFPNPNHHC